MYKISYRIANEGWTERTFLCGDNVILTAYLKAVREIKRAVQSDDIQLLPLGAYQFVIWGQGRCQGFLSIAEHGQEILAPDLDGGQ